MYTRLEKEGRLTRPKHWLEFAPFQMAHTPLNITIPEVQDEVRYAWTNSYSPAATERALDSIENEPAPYKINHLASRLAFRGIFFPPKGAWQWMKLIAQNRGPIFQVVRDSITRWHGTQDGAGKTSTADPSPVSYSAQPTRGDSDTDLRPEN
jgi:hypothetical protein